MRIQRALAIAALILASVTTARATTTYASQASLEASTPALTFQPIDLTTCVGDGVSQPCIGNPYTSITVSGITFTDSTGSGLLVLNATTIKQNVSSGTVTVTLPSNVLAFGSAITFFGTASLTVNYTGDGSSGNISYFQSTPDYLGVRVNAAPITGVSYVNSFQPFSLSGFEVGTGSISSTPEAGTLLSVAGGLLLLVLSKRKAGF